MADLGPGEVFERFREDLEQVHRDRALVTGIEAEAVAAAGEYPSEFVESFKEVVQKANGDAEAAEGTALAAIEAAAGNNPTSREAMDAVMRAKGKTDEEIESHYEHLERTREEQQPVIVIAGDEAGLGMEGLITVTYGLTATEKDLRSFMKTYIGPGTLKDVIDRVPGLRNIAIVAKSQRGFTVSGLVGSEYPTDLFADMPEGERFSAIQANANPIAHPFEEVHFANTAEEVRDTAETIVGAYRKPSFADAVAVKALGLPTMVAYGEDAVLELSQRIGETNPQNRILARRCIEGLGIDMDYIAEDLPDGSIPDLSDKIISEFGNYLFREFDGALTDFLHRGGSKTSDSARELAFLGPLQDAIGYHPDTVLAQIQSLTPAVYMEKKGEVVPLYSNKGTIKTVKETVVKAVQSVNALGIRSQGPDSPTAADVTRELKKEAIDRAIEQVTRNRSIFNQLSPRTFFKLFRLRQALQKV